MPIFEYKCLSCSEEFEKLMLGTKPDPPICPKCGARQKVVKILSPLKASSIKMTGGQRFLNNGKTDC